MLIEAISLAQIINPKEPLPQPKPIETVQVEPKKEKKTKPKPKYYVIKRGDTINRLSKSHRVPVRRLLCANPKVTNPDVIDAGDRLRIPKPKDKIKCAKPKEIKARVRGRSYAGAGWFNPFQCTGYVASRRPVGRWHNADTWVYMARAEGWATGTKPRVGAIGQQGNHVVYIEKVKGNQVYISERNYDFNGSYRERWANASDFLYIY